MPGLTCVDPLNLFHLKVDAYNYIYSKWSLNTLHINYSYTFPTFAGKSCGKGGKRWHQFPNKAPRCIDINDVCDNSKCLDQCKKEGLVFAHIKRSTLSQGIYYCMCSRAEWCRAGLSRKTYKGAYEYKRSTLCPALQMFVMQPDKYKC